MSGAMRRIGEYLGLLEDTGTYAEYDELGGVDENGYPTQQTRAVAPEADQMSTPDVARLLRLALRALSKA